MDILQDYCIEKLLLGGIITGYQFFQNSERRGENREERKEKGEDLIYTNADSIYITDSQNG
jgi:hypothetical protein